MTLKSQYPLTFTLWFHSQHMTFHSPTSEHPNLDKQKVSSLAHPCSFNCLLTGDTLPMEEDLASSHQTQLVNMCCSEPDDLQRWSHHTPDTATQNNGSLTSSCLSLRWHPEKHYPSDRPPRKYNLFPCVLFFSVFSKLFLRAPLIPTCFVYF